MAQKKKKQEHKCVNMKEDTFYKRYQPVANHINPNRGWGCDEKGCLFETYGKELEHVLEINKTEPGRVWTLMDGSEDSNMYIESGYHIVNRVGYFITSKPCPANRSISVCIEFDNNEEETE